MRIECEACNRAYNIDDAQLADQPVGAQCPYCGHVQLVSKAAAPAPSESRPYGQPPGMGFGPQPGAALSQTSGGSAAPGAGSSTAGFGDTGGLSLDSSDGLSFAGGLSSTGGLSLNTGGLDLPGQTGGLSLDSGSLPGVSGGFSLDTGGLSLESGSLPGGGSGLSLDTAAPMGSSGDLRGVSGSGDVGGGGTCQVCGKALSDEFDKVIGLCEEHQRGRRSADLDSNASAGWYCRARSGEVAGPLSLDQLRARVRDGAFSTDAEFSRDGVDFGPISRYKELAYLASLASTTATGERLKPPVSSGVGGLGRVLTPALILIVLVAVGVGAFTQRDKIGRLIRGLKGGAGQLSSGPNPLKRYLEQWGKEHPDRAGSASEHLVTAEAEHNKDTDEGYKKAEGAYQLALLLDENNPQAISGYAENLALWRFDRTPPEEVQVAKAAVRYAIGLDPKAAEPHRALAALALAEGDLNGCGVAADQALSLRPGDPRAQLLRASCYLEGNVELAAKELKAVREKAPQLKRGVRVLAQALVGQGYFKQAEALLLSRLTQEPNNGRLRVQYGQLLAMLGRTDAAEEALRAAVAQGGDPQAAQVALGDLLLSDRRWSGAAAAYRRAAGSPHTYGSRATRLYTGWAKASLMQGDAKQAEEKAKRALEFDARAPAAFLILGEVALAREDANEAAAMARRLLAQREGEPSALVLEARAALLGGDAKAAATSIRLAISSDRKSVILKGILGGIYLTQGPNEGSFAVMRKAADIDPRWQRDHDRDVRLEVNPAAAKEAIKRFEKSSQRRENAAVANAAVAMLRYQLGEAGPAGGAVDQALDSDESNAAALLYLSQLLMDDDDPREAKRNARRLLRVERGFAMAHLELARAELALGRRKQATRSFKDALRSQRALVPAQVGLAHLAAIKGKKKSRAEAIKELHRILEIDPSYRPVRVLLYELGE